MLQLNIGGGIWKKLYQENLELRLKIMKLAIMEKY